MKKITDLLMNKKGMIIILFLFLLVSFNVQRSNAQVLSVDLGADLNFCYPQSTNINANVTGGMPPYQYSWSTSPYDVSSNISVYPSQTITYTVTVTDNVFNTATDQVVVQVQNLPPVSIDNVNNNVCKGQSITLTARGVDKYNWSTGDSVSTINVTPVYSQSYYVTGTLLNGCISNASIWVNVIDVPNVFAGNDRTLCSGDNLYMDGVSATYQDSVKWSTTGTGYFGYPNYLYTYYQPSYTDSMNGSFKLILTAFGQCGISKDTATITLAPSPTAYVGPYATICFPQDSFLISSSVIKNQDSLIWSTNGSGYFDNPKAIHPTYYFSATDKNNGYVNLFLQVYRGTCTKWSNVSISINKGTKINADRYYSICSGEDFNFSNVWTSNADSIKWTTLGSGYFGNQYMPNTYYHPSSSDSANGTVNLFLTAKGYCGIAKDTITLNINPAPVAIMELNKHICNTQDSLLLINTNIANEDSIYWITSGGGYFNDPNAKHPVYYLSSQDKYYGYIYLNLYVTKGNCTINRTMNLSINGTPYVNAGMDKTICTGQSFYTYGSYPNTSNSIDSLRWTTTGNGYFYNPNQLYTDYYPTPSDSANGSVKLILTGFGCGAGRDTMNLTFSPAPLANAGPDANICPNQNSYTLSLSNFANQDSLIWSTNGSGYFDNPNSNHPTYYLSAMDKSWGNVILSAHAIKGNCTLQDDMMLQINKVFAGTNTSICSGQDFYQYDANAFNSDSVKWSTTGTGYFYNPNQIYTSYHPGSSDSANGSVDLILTAYQTCGIFKDTMKLSISPAPTANINYQASVCSTQDTYTFLSADIENQDSVRWSSYGNGYFDNPTSIHPTYYISASDKSMGYVNLNVQIYKGSCVLWRNVMLRIYNNPVVEAGADYTIAAGDNFYTNNVISNNVDSVKWTTTGNGYFSNPGYLYTSYFSDLSDTLNGNVKLILTGYSPCGITKDTMTLSINKPSIVFAGKDAYICETQNTFTLAQSNVTDADSLIWTTSGTGYFNNPRILHPVYNIMTSDKSMGYVYFTLTAYKAGNMKTSYMYLNFDKVPSAYAGTGASICVGNYFTTYGASASNFKSVNWMLMGGIGTLNKPDTIRTTFTSSAPGTSKLVLIAYGGACGIAKDSILINVNSGVTANAGTDANICENQNTFVLASANAAGQDSINWITSGTGNFNNPHIINPVYNVGVNDKTINLGKIYLVMETHSAGCGFIRDTMVLKINLNPNVIINASKPSLCLGATDTLFANGAASYVWNSTLGSGNIKTVSPTVNTSYTVTGTSPVGCSNIANFVVNVIPKPTVTANVNLNSVCVGSPVIFNGDGANSYIWDNGVNDGIEYTPTISNTYIVTGTDINGCKNTAQVAVAVNPLPNVIANATVNTICYGSNTTLTGAGAVSYSWNNGVIDGLPIAPLTSTVYTVTGTDANGCKSTSGITITVNPKPSIYAYAVKPSICTGNADTLIVTGASNYFWNSGCSDNTCIVYPATSTSYTVTGTSAYGCTNTATAFVTVNTAPMISAGKDTIICKGNSVSLFATGGNSYMWNNGSIMNYNFVSPSTTTTYTVTGIDANGCKATDDVVVWIKQGPTAYAGMDVTICEGQTYKINDATANNYDNITWWTETASGSFDNGSAINPEYTPDATDISNGYVRIFFESVESGCANAKDTLLITINKKPVVNAGTDAMICQNNKFMTYGAYANNYKNLYWTTSGNGTFNKADTTFVEYTPGNLDVSTGNVYLILTANSNMCGNQSDTLMLTVNAGPIANAGPDAVICAGNAHELLSASASGYDMVNWFTSGDGSFNSYNIINPTYIPGPNDILSGNVSLIINAYKTGGCGSMMDTMQLSVSKLPVVNADDYGTICSNGSFVTYAATASNYTSLNWTTTGDGHFDKIDSLLTTYYPGINDISSGKTDLILTGYNSCGMSSDTMKGLIIISAPVVNAGPDQSIAYGASTKLFATGGGTYLWNSGNTTDTIVVSPTITTTYNVTATLNGCTAGSGVVVYVSDPVYNITGNLTYSNSANTPLDNVNLTLEDYITASVIKTAKTDASGNYVFDNIPNGSYRIKATTTKPWGGVSAMDVTDFMKFIGNVPGTVLAGVDLLSGDANGSGTVTSIDLTIIKQKIVNPTVVNFANGDWVFDNSLILVNGSDVIYDFKGVCSGDENGSYTPAAGKKLGESIVKSVDQTITPDKNGEFDLPLKLSESVKDLASVTVYLNYPANLAEVKDVQMVSQNKELVYSVKNGKISMVFSTLNALNLNKGDVLATIKLKLINGVNTSEAINLNVYGEGELGNFDGQVINNTDILIPNSILLEPNGINIVENKSLNIYPNPVNNQLNIINVGNSQLKVYNTYGEEMISVEKAKDHTIIDMSNYASGTYFVKIFTKDGIVVKKIDVIK
ncbi:MAG: T9SS type A sorting domain-containing protein [Bacteroidota bacterium]|nr:T9SS type A sorting domain-containing protein [Bacteroidota bacterium]